MLQYMISSKGRGFGRPLALASLIFLPKVLKQEK